MKINRVTNQINGLGYSAYEKLRTSDKQEIITIIFTKGKEELMVENIERVNVYDECITIVLKDNTSIFINLLNVTQIR
jgi:hypothetical protein